MEKSPDHINSTSSTYHNPGVFDKSTYRSTLLDVMDGVIQALQMMIVPSYPVFENKEDIITGRLIEDFLEKDEIREQFSLKDYWFLSESATYNSEYKQIGYADIRVRVQKNIHAFDTTKADYIIECKCLDGKNGKNKKYVKDGIYRFIEEKYTSKNVHKVSAMIGYVVSRTDILACVEAINEIGRASELACFVQELAPCQIRPEFEYSYYSAHHTVNGNKAEVYHVLFDLCDKVI